MKSEQKFVFNRNFYEKAIIQLMREEQYVQQSFYAFVAAKCNLVKDENMPAIAGVAFNEENLSYDLYINPVLFSTISDEERIGVIIHEMLHILGGHTYRKGERDHELFNRAADIALNQNVHVKLPEGALFPSTYDLPVNKTAEIYYDLLKNNKKFKEEQEEQEKNEKEMKDKLEDAINKAINGDSSDLKKMLENGEIKVDDHDKFNTANADDDDSSKSDMSDVIRDITNNMIKDAAEKSRGMVPSDYAAMIALWNAPPKISWKKQLKKYIGSIRGSKKSTIKRNSRRFGKSRPELRGKVKDIQKHNVIAGFDISGSMSDDEIIMGLHEVNDIVKRNGILKVAQIDTNVKSLEEYKENSTFKRNGCGGTIMSALPEYLMEENIKCDVLVMISDCEIENISTDPFWKKWNTPVLWLSTTGICPRGIESMRKHECIDLKNL